MIRDKRLFWLYVIGVVYAILCLFFSTYDYPDTESYYVAYDKLINGEIDLFRTPVYPLFIGGIRSLAGAAHAKLVTVIAQHAIILWTFLYFYRLLCSVCRSNMLIICASLIYVASPYVAGSANFILTEPMAIAGMTIFSYLIYRIVTEDVSPKSCYISLGLSLLYLFFLRPQFVFLTVVCLTAIVAAAIRKRNVIRLVLATAIPTIALLAYCDIIYHKCGVFSPSTVSVVNKYTIMRHDHITDFEGTDNKELAASINDFIINDTVFNPHSTYEAFVLGDKYGWDELNRFVDTACRHNPKQYVAGLFMRWYNLQDDSFHLYHCPMDIASILWFRIFKSFNAFVAVLALYLVFIGVCTHRKRAVPWGFVALWLIAMGNVATTVIGAHMEWGRLCMPSIPLVTIMVAQMMQELVGSR